MLPRKLTAVDSESVRFRYKIVRADNLVDVPGLIMSADIATGLCVLRQSDGVSQDFNFGSDGIRIVVAGR